MKAILSKIYSLVMAVVVMFSTMSFTVGKHYCGDHLVDVALFSSANSCGADMQQPSDSDGCNIQKKSCCTDEVSTVKGQEDLKTSFEKLDFQQQAVLVAFAYSYIDLFQGLEENIIPHNNYPPPILVRDIQVLDEVFLI